MTEVERPSPEKLLGLLAREEAKTRHGRLKIFFGMAPGVGKTYAMLAEARRLSGSGLDVVVGWVETHGRSETALLAEGLPRVEPLTVPHRGISLSELDLDAALARRPALLLVDELAHSNAPGVRHPKRYQDVLELLEAGIDVHTTLNVQHLESLNDVVAGITGVAVRERVPDSVFDAAEEVELVDLPTPDLLQRLSEGKVYVPEQAQRAVERFFTASNLTALRELSLRRTAERVHDQADLLREQQGITSPWATRDKLMVAVGPAPQSAKLVRAAYRMASRLRIPWIAATVENARSDALSAKGRARVEAHLALAESLGAEILVLRGDDVSAQVLAAAKERGVTRLLVGKPAGPRPVWNRLRPSPVDRLVRDSGGIDILVTTGEDDEGDRPEEKPRRVRAPISEYAWSVAAVALATAVGLLFRSRLQLGDHALIYVLTILLVSLRLTPWPAMLSALLSVAAIDFFFVPPFYTFAVADPRVVVTFGVLLAVGLSVSRLTLRVRREAKEARERERRTASLYAFSRKLAAERKLDAICRAAQEYVRDMTQAEAAIWVAGGRKALVLRGPVSAWMHAERERSAALWAFDHRKPVGRSTDTLPSTEGFYLPMVVAGRAVGALGVRHGDRSWTPTTAQKQLLEVVASLAAQAVARTRLAKEAHDNRVRAETEQLRNDLLSTLSHDLRTPLSSLTGAVALLADPGGMLSPDARSKLLATSRAEADRLARLIDDVTELTRLESNVFKLEKEWCPVEEVVASALGRVAPRLEDREIQVRQPERMVVAPMDAVLVEQVLVNLLENAGKHTPASTAIEIGVEERDGAVAISVADRGAGIPAGEEERIFEKYHRVMGDRATPGMGIGLALCRAIVTIHGGAIRARNREGGGAVFSFTLPVEGEPPKPEEPGDGA
jgi:two-component system, OmpR family, sensor histidine kinase KdpD